MVVYALLKTVGLHGNTLRFNASLSSHDRSHRTLFLCRYLAVVSTAIMLLGCQPKQSDIDRELGSSQSTFSPLLASIESYRAANGGYPRNLSDLKDFAIPKIASPKDFNSLRPVQLIYEVGRDLTFFRVSYGLNDADDYELHGLSVYSSLERKWVITRYSSRLPHVEARHYGSVYAASLSRATLDLAVQSLLDAAALNSDHPCRNFWHAWIVESLGPGDIRQVEPPTGTKELMTYWDERKRPAYAFAVAEVLYPPMTAPLKIATGVYRMKPENTEWTLVQACDSSS